MRKSFKVVLVLWAIAMIAWVVVMILNIRFNGWGIIGPRDIWPMILATTGVIACLLTERKRAPKANDDDDKTATN